MKAWDRAVDVALHRPKTEQDCFFISFSSSFFFFFFFFFFLLISRFSFIVFGDSVPVTKPIKNKKKKEGKKKVLTLPSTTMNE